MNNIKPYCNCRTILFVYLYAEKKEIKYVIKIEKGSFTYIIIIYTITIIFHIIEIIKM